jgi:hypothetical protein
LKNEMETYSVIPAEAVSGNVVCSGPRRKVDGLTRPTDGKHPIDPEARLKSFNGQRTVLAFICYDFHATTPRIQPHTGNEKSFGIGEPNK